MNSVVLVGRLGRDPELRYIPSGAAVANFSLAIDSRPKDGERRPPTWVNVVAWQKLAEVVTEYLQKGSRIGVKGRLQSRSWETQEGQKRSVLEVVAEEIEFLSNTRGREEVPTAEPEPAPESTEDDSVLF